MAGGMLFPDIAGALSSGAQAGAASAQGRFLMEDRAARNEIAPLIPKALQGDREALDKIGARHPDTLMKITPLLERADASTRARAKETAEWTTKAAMGVLSLPEAERPAAYQAALADGQRLGYKIDMPPQYDRAVEGRLRMVVNQARSVSDFLKSQGEGVTFAPPVGGGGAPAPGDGDRAAGAIAGIESGGKYDAVGPVANKAGNRAYGKYQVMDFNVGPWTQEVLGQAMTPQQFLASPQAQDAVFKVKFGQYVQKHGSPEAASRAWFAGEGGMNNPNATDVLGTSVQGYGQKFAQAYGPGATGPGPQIAQGDNTRADGSGTPLPPAQQALAPLRGLQIPPGARVALKGGLPVIQDGNVLYLDANGNWGAAPLPSRAAPKEQGSGPFAGNSVEAQALNMLIANRTLTPQQAAELAAGKTVTDPETKQIIFKTPSGIFGQVPGQAPQPLAAPPAAPQGGAPMPSAGGPPAGVPAPAAPVPANAGSIPLTGTKTTGQPSAAEMANLRAARVELEKITAAAEDFKKEWAKATPVERARTLSGAPTPLASSYYNFALLAKGDVLYKLGVLNGPDLTIIQKSLPDPSTWSSVMANDNDVIGAVDKALNLVKIGVSGTERQFGIAPPQQGAAPAKAPKGTYMGPDNKPVAWPEIEATAKNRGITPDEVINRLGLKPTGMQ